MFKTSLLGFGGVAAQPANTPARAAMAITATLAVVDLVRIANTRAFISDLPDPCS
jgi:uncharacterized membrane protein YtjA (UPF0391 family)